MSSETLTTTSITTHTCDLCRSSVASTGKRPKKWLDVWLSDTKPAASSYEAYLISRLPSSVFNDDKPTLSIKFSTLCPRCAYWISPLLPTEMLHKMK